uniref:Uncharacterized protein n=1 Tax=Glossina austeni TaxID=7395 RepID=A0A1A9VW59_GLOAU
MLGIEISSSFLTAAVSFLSIPSSLDVVSSQSASFSTRRGFPVACVLRPPMVPLRDARARTGLTDDLRLAANLTDSLEDDFVDGLATRLTDCLTVVLTDALEAGLVDALEDARAIKALEGALAEGLILALQQVLLTLNASVQESHGHGNFLFKTFRVLANVIKIHIRCTYILSTVFCTHLRTVTLDLVQLNRKEETNKRLKKLYTATEEPLPIRNIERIL